MGVGSKAAQSDSFHFVVFFQDEFPEPWSFQSMSSSCYLIDINQDMKKGKMINRRIVR